MTGDGEALRFAIVGSGWRSLFYLRVAQAVPERFKVSGVVTGVRQHTEELKARGGIEAYSDLQDLLRSGHPDFVVLSVKRLVTVEWLEQLVKAGLPVLCETPPAGDLEGLRRVNELVGNGLVQVAEQYQFQPLHAARLALTDGGHLGEVSMASLSVCHDYHAFSLMRRHLRIRDEPASIRASIIRSRVESGFSFTGPRREKGTVEEVRTVGLVEFGPRFGIYDFAGEQYFSYVRPPHVNIRGATGEIFDHDLRQLPGLDQPVTSELRREHTGLGEEQLYGGYSLRGISAGDAWVYTNPFPGARLSDDEIAVATCLELMGRYVRGGRPFYGLADASHDHYLSLLLHRAAATGETVRTEPQPWTDALLDVDTIGGEPLPVVSVDKAMTMSVL